MSVDLDDLFRDTPVPPETFTVHIRVLSIDVLPTQVHEAHDAKVLERLEQEGPNMKQPKERKDYIALVQLVAETFGSFEKVGTLKTGMKRIEAKYGSDETAPEVWADFKRLIDTCLAERKFRMIRCLREFWGGLGDTNLRWSKITDYPGSFEQCRAEEERRLKQKEMAETDGEV